MDCIAILAKTAETVKTAGRTPEAVEEAIVPIDLIWEHITSLNLRKRQE